MKHIKLFVVLGLAAFSAKSQQLTTSSFYDLHGTLHNPATVGTKHYGTVGGTFRKMWDGMPGGPQTGVVFGSAYLPNPKLGLGGYLYSDKVGSISYTGLQTAYSYHIPLRNNTSFSIGLEARLQQFSYDKEKLQQSLGGLDPVIGGDDNRFKADAGLGVAYTTQKFQVGASVSQLVQSKLDLYTGAGTPNEQSKLYRHYYLHGNYNWDVDNSTRIIPNFLVIYLPNAPTEYQIGARVEHNNLFWYGLSVRARQSWMLSAGVRIKQRFNIGYSFDVYTTPLSVYDKGSSGHELMLRYDFIK